MNKPNIHCAPVTLICIKLSFLFTLLTLFTACATVISEDECRYANFATIGYDDASKGRLRDHFNNYHKKCLTYEINIAEEIVMYDFGRERGLLGYCENVRVSSQCNRGSGRGLKSYLLIPTEMLRLNEMVPPAIAR